MFLIVIIFQFMINRFKKIGSVLVVLIEKEKKENEQRRIIENMQRVQSNADIWNLEQMNKLATAPKTSAIQDELMKTLNDRIGVATDAQIYLYYLLFLKTSEWWSLRHYLMAYR